ncbi:contractile injection system protein, VgrG/Pvc8 family [Methanolobus sediminis]|uniref:Contractile injection system protein, VgrG/Pvc8 family n=1 Tax=Methanolobus sediminis TaxID=3072978 RepID=A0AA51UK90_9EURY|nr:contractile injection system protein, VgrG/Pvc8 family [Methanolobus sediminis]WMW25087.1 contractile injection system protein, VgrG/Pvc8 family [Methanolobus sediminis]
MPENIVSTVPIFKIKVDGNELSAKSMASVESVIFEEELNTASMFILKLATSDFEKGGWQHVDLKDFHLGSEIKLYMGMDDLVLMIAGEVTSLKPTFSESFSTIEIRGYDRLHRLRFGTKRRTFVDVKDSDIASSIAGEWGLSAKVEDTGTVHPHIYQNNQNDLEFILQRAKRIRYELFVDDRTLHFRSPKESDPASLVLEYRVDLEEFSADLSARYEGDEIVVQGWDYIKKKQVSATSKSERSMSTMNVKNNGTNMTESAFGKFSSYIVDEHPVDNFDAEKLAVARYNKHLVGSVTGDGKCTGIPKLRAGNTIEIKGIGRFSGTYYVTSTSHVIDYSGYKTSFKVRRGGI